MAGLSELVKHLDIRTKAQRANGSGAPAFNFVEYQQLGHKGRDIKSTNVCSCNGTASQS